MRQFLLKKVFCFTLRNGNVFVGIIFIITCSFAIILSSSLPSTNLFKLIQINCGFHIVFLFPTISFFIGICFQVKDLIVPFLLATFQGIVLPIVSLIMAGVLTFFKKKSTTADSKDPLFYNYAFVALWSVQIPIHLFVFYVSFSYWHRLQFELQEYDEDNLEDLQKDYAFRRFENIDV